MRSGSIVVYRLISTTSGRVVRGALRDLAGLTEGAEDVPAEDLVDVGLGVAAAEQFVGQPGEVGDVFQADRPSIDAVEVRADADVVDPRDLDEVVDVVGDVRTSPGALTVPARGLAIPDRVRFNRRPSALGTMKPE